MKKLFRKELPEETKVALPGLAVFTLVLMQVYKSCTSELASVASGQGWLNGDDMQPLLSSALQNEALCFCALFGIVLGWLQIRAEKHRDLWAFLIHRPITRTAILRSKVASGLCLYALGAGLPLLGFIAFVRTPGHVAAPFEWAMTLPVAAIFLLGILYYFAGMLTALRQARWYGSRGFGLGMAIAATMGVMNVDEFWQALLILLGGVAVLATAVWGSFQSGGCYRGQSLSGRLTLAATSVAATILLIGVSAFGLLELLAMDSSVSSSEYVMTSYGTLYKLTRRGIEDPDIVDLKDKPLLDEKAGKPMTMKEFDKRRAQVWVVFARFGRSDQWNNYERGYTSSWRFFNPWQVADKAFWYLTRDGRLVGYNGITRRQAGTFQAPESSSGEKSGFIPEMNYANGFNGYDSEVKRVQASATTVYLVDLENHVLQPIFNVTNDDRIGGYAEVHYRDPCAFVVTRKSIQFLNTNGQMAWSIPYEPAYPDYPQVTALALQSAGRFAVEFGPDYRANEKSGWKMPTRVDWLSVGQGISKSLDLPNLPSPKPDDFWEKMASLLMPPAYPMYIGDPSNRIWDLLRFIPAILCVLTGWRIGRRYSFPAKAQIGWGVFHLLFGLPGLLAFLSVQEWPARETCPHCKRLRVVDREKCPHCGADFAPPEKTGTEIFEPLAAN